MPALPIYHLRQALTLNATGQKFDAVATSTTASELRRHQHQFVFRFAPLLRAGYSVYKLCLEGQPDIVQGLVAFRPCTGVLDCANMETAAFNKEGSLLYGGVGKALIALCCKASFDAGLDGYITFEAKNRLMPYYRRFGAELIFGLRMAIATKAARKLVEQFF